MAAPQSEIEVVRTSQDVRDVPESALPQDRDEHVHGWRVAPVGIGARAGVEATTWRRG